MTAPTTDAPPVCADCGATDALRVQYLSIAHGVVGTRRVCGDPNACALRAEVRDLRDAIRVAQTIIDDAHRALGTEGQCSLLVAIARLTQQRNVARAALAKVSP